MALFGSGHCLPTHLKEQFSTRKTLRNKSFYFLYLFLFSISLFHQVFERLFAVRIFKILFVWREKYLKTKLKSFSAQEHLQPC
jgi:hypothetical protein